MVWTALFPPPTPQFIENTLPSSTSRLFRSIARRLLMRAGWLKVRHFSFFFTCLFFNCDVSPAIARPEFYSNSSTQENYPSSRVFRFVISAFFRLTKVLGFVFSPSLSVPAIASPFNFSARYLISFGFSPDRFWSPFLRSPLMHMPYCFLEDRPLAD